MISQATACMSIASAISTKTPAAIPTTAPLPRLVDLLGDLDLGELDLLADEDRDALGDVEDELADGAVVVGRRSGGALRRAGPPHRVVAIGHAHSGGSSS